ncbi:hypothetical protein CCC_01312 [Paramagnetospirillum magnetotacticum MS-1]|uniref:Uncharacterized protein n=1 Tax=Paramagnetospirillum magnetotacticum MS-1 TaxID=272627 RepID=A0A0C2UZK2_PARME|nr:hypothetical protein CCC_01312 [Paramagnetospirillum magnetotacticum MS-1]
MGLRQEPRQPHHLPRLQGGSSRENQAGHAHRTESLSIRHRGETRHPRHPRHPNRQ